MVSIKLWASSIMTTLPSSFIPQASLVDLWRRMLYGKTTSWKLRQNLQQLIHLHALFWKCQCSKEHPEVNRYLNFLNMQKIKLNLSTAATLRTEKRRWGGGGYKEVAVVERSQCMDYLFAGTKKWLLWRGGHFFLIH